MAELDLPSNEIVQNEQRRRALLLHIRGALPDDSSEPTEIKHIHGEDVQDTLDVVWAVSKGTSSFELCLNVSFTIEALKLCFVWKARGDRSANLAQAEPECHLKPAQAVSHQVDCTQWQNSYTAIPWRRRLG